MNEHCHGKVIHQSTWNIKVDPWTHIHSPLSSPIDFHNDHWYWSRWNEWKTVPENCSCMIILYILYWILHWTLSHSIQPMILYFNMHSCLLYSTMPNQHCERFSFSSKYSLKHLWIMNFGKWKTPLINIHVDMQIYLALFFMFFFTRL
jgi:hypothetical protein